MNRRCSRAAVAAALMALSPLTSLAGSVYLNGVLIDGVTNQKFEKATVRIDESGNVHIEAPGYAARVSTTTAPPPPTPTANVAPPPTTAPAAKPASPPAPATQEGGGVATAPATPPPPAAKPAAGHVTQRYFLVTEQSVPGMTGYDIDVYVNSKWLRRLRGNEDQVIADITNHLKPGDNVVTMMAKKTTAGGARSDSPKHVFRVIIGEGNEGGGNVMIDNPLVRFQTSAAETQDVTQEFTLSTR
ncbi:hypothetical protein LZ198_36205 [Myxococcus sp. K15C18031901]|uniref:hypothetical protein n=1 Tax=Myxococcus dinghuensis TaxID=2906761 RepID=UPI0020A796CC|nr:hypothetical protein [Myxococcus dinghuensis]MCP3104322.1 hypothetical protein [Myxococcus dinghuensis]